MHFWWEHWIETAWLHKLEIANLFPPDFLGYVYKFGYYVIYELVLQIFLHQIFKVMCMDLTINQDNDQLEGLMVPLI